MVYRKKPIKYGCSVCYHKFESAEKEKVCPSCGKGTNKMVYYPKYGSDHLWWLRSFRLLGMPRDYTYVPEMFIVEYEDLQRYAMRAKSEYGLLTSPDMSTPRKAMITESRAVDVPYGMFSDLMHIWKDMLRFRGDTFKDIYEGGTHQLRVAREDIACVVKQVQLIDYAIEKGPLVVKGWIEELERTGRQKTLAEDFLFFKEGDDTIVVRRTLRAILKVMRQGLE